MKTTKLLLFFMLMTHCAFSQTKPKPIVLQGRYGSIEKIYIFKVEDTSLLTVSPATYSKLKSQPLFDSKEIENLMKEGKYGYESQTYVVEEIGSIDILGSGTKARARGIAMVVGGLVGGIVGAVVHGGKDAADCDNDFLPFTAGCVVDRGASIPVHSIGIGVGIGALLGGFFSTPPIKININGQQSKFDEQKEKMREFAILR